ncbi:MAG: macrocin O-methyltransferase [Candidatus Margulisbacteria bacterium]|nr:macrocin O-methyltransferase [Candidatus Margulisiibacteriota bacterium]
MLNNFRGNVKYEDLPKSIRPLISWLWEMITYFSGAREYEKEIHKKLAFGVNYVYIAGIEGDIAEFGTMTGKTASVIAKSIPKNEFRFGVTAKKLHLFDSFAGLPEADSPVDKNSPHVRSGTWTKGTCRGISQARLIKMINKYLPKERIAVYAGWFKDTLINIPAGTKFAMVHIDSDLYQSAVEVLGYLFKNRLVPEGGVLFFDDYNCNLASPKYGERRAWAETVERFTIKYTDCGEYGWGGWKFIVHSYSAGSDKGV